MKIWKNALILALTVSMLFGVLAVPRAFATTATISAPGIEDEFIVPDGNPTTPELSIDVMIENSEALVAFDFELWYDTSVLTAVASSAYSPFTYPSPSWIDNVKGYTFVSASYPPPEFVGFYEAGPYPIMNIAFSVDGMGASPLMIVDPHFGNTSGVAMPLTIVPGWFRNVAGQPIAWFTGPLDPEVNTPVTVKSESFDPLDGSITKLDWYWGDGSQTLNGLVEESHTYTVVGDYSITLIVTDNDLQTDSESRTVIISPPPLGGAIATSAHASRKYLDLTQNGFNPTQWLMGTAKNIDPLGRDELVRVDLEVWSANWGQVGSVMTDYAWIAAGQQARFKGIFDPLDPKWHYVGWGYTYDEFTFFVRVYYADFFFNNDPNSPHWAQVPNPPEESYTFSVNESPPVPVTEGAYTYDSLTGVITFDGSKCTDPDTKWGDFLGGWRWQIQEQGIGQIGQVFGLNPTLTLPEDGYYRFRVRVEDMIAVRVQSAYTEWIYFDVP